MASKLQFESNHCFVFQMCKCCIYVFKTHLLRAHSHPGTVQDIEHVMLSKDPWKPCLHKAYRILETSNDDKITKSRRRIIKHRRGKRKDIRCSESRKWALSQAKRLGKVSLKTWHLNCDINVKQKRKRKKNTEKGYFLGKRMSMPLAW